MRVELDRVPAQVLDRIHNLDRALARRLEDAIGWIEDGDPRARRRIFTNGMRAITVRDDADEEWLIVWQEPEQGLAVIECLGASASL